VREREEGGRQGEEKRGRKVAGVQQLREEEKEEDD
jgi:hypothetical protein